MRASHTGHPMGPSITKLLVTMALVCTMAKPADAALPVSVTPPVLQLVLGNVKGAIQWVRDSAPSPSPAWDFRASAPVRAAHVLMRVALATSTLPPFRFTTPESYAAAVLTELPVDGELSSPFGYRRDPIKRRRRKHHKGLDFAAKRGTLVRAAGPGIVTRVQRSGGYGRLVIIDHGNGLHTRYAHLQRFKVKRGEYIPGGAVVGTVGSSGRATGPHLHFEVRQDGVALPPTKVVNFKLPKCAKRARDCRRGRRPNS